MNELSKTKKYIIDNLDDVILKPVLINEEDLDLKLYKKIPLSNIATYGISLNSITSAITNYINIGKSGIYKVTVPAGGHLASFKDGSGYLGSTLSDVTNKVGTGQAILSPISFNPTMLFMSVVLSNINRKMDEIKCGQEVIVNHLLQKDKSEITGDLNYLNDVWNKYKQNWDNEKFKNANYIKVLDIKNKSLKHIDFNKKQILNRCYKEKSIHNYSKTQKIYKEVENYVENYQASVYIYSFSCFLETILLENYNSAYLNNIIADINNQVYEYREIYTKCYNVFEMNFRSSNKIRIIETCEDLSEDLSEATESIINVIKPLMNNTINKNIKNVKNIESTSSNLIKEQMQSLNDKSKVHAKPFIDNLKTLDDLYNNDFELCFDEENLYIKN